MHTDLTDVRADLTDVHAQGMQVRKRSGTRECEEEWLGGAGALGWKRGCGSRQRLTSQPEGEGDTENGASLAIRPEMTIVQLPTVLSEVQGPGQTRVVSR